MRSHAYLYLSLLYWSYAPTAMSFSFFSPKVPQPCTIVLYPAAPATSAATQIALQLKSKLESYQRVLQVVIAPNAAAQTANQLGAQLFISLTVSATAQTPAAWHWYYYTRQRFCPQLTPQRLAFYPAHELYRFHCDQTSNWAHKLSAYLAQTPYQTQFVSHPPLGLPYRPLLGVNAPAIGLELHLPDTPLALENYVDPLSESIYQCVQQII